MFSGGYAEVSNHWCDETILFYNSQYCQSYSPFGMTQAIRLLAEDLINLQSSLINQAKVQKTK
jgi:hypothetical protein